VFFEVSRLTVPIGEVAVLVVLRSFMVEPARFIPTKVVVPTGIKPTMAKLTRFEPRRFTAIRLFTMVGLAYALSAPLVPTIPSR